MWVNELPIEGENETVTRLSDAWRSLTDDERLSMHRCGFSDLADCVRMCDLSLYEFYTY